MAQALITINGVAGSNTDLPINTVVQLNNTNNGGEVAYEWEIVDQPVGTEDVLSSTTIQNPTFTPTKEGSYLIRLWVNKGLVTQASDTVIASVLQVKTRIRVPAVGETTELGDSGWAQSVNAILQKVDTMRADPGVCVCVANLTGLSEGQVVWFEGVTRLKTGLDGEEVLPNAELALATSAAVSGTLGMVIGPVNEDAVSIEEGDLIYVRRFGYAGFKILGSYTVGTPVYVSNTGTLAMLPGTFLRQVGSIVYDAGGGGGEGGSFSAVYFDGAAFNDDCAQSALVTTTTAAVTTLLTIAIPSNVTVMIDATILARNTGASESAGYRVFGTYRNVAGVLTQVGLSQTVVHEDVAGWDATLDTSSTNVRVRVTGENAKTINWSVRATKVTVL